MTRGTLMVFALGCLDINITQGARIAIDEVDSIDAETFDSTETYDSAETSDYAEMSDDDLDNISVMFAQQTRPERTNMIKIQNREHGNCLADNTNLWHRHSVGTDNCHNTRNQQRWNLVPFAGTWHGRTNTFRILNEHTNKCAYAKSADGRIGSRDCDDEVDTSPVGDYWRIRRHPIPGETSIVLESKQFPERCVTADSEDDDLRMRRCLVDAENQKWDIAGFNPPSDGVAVPMTNTRGYWASAGSSISGDFKDTLSTGIERSDSEAVSNEVQLGLALGVESAATFLGTGVTATADEDTRNAWSKQVEESQTTMSSSECEVHCQTGDLPSGAFGWSMYQWQLRGEMANGANVVTKTCHYICMPRMRNQDVRIPQCGQGLCANSLCSRCLQR